MPVREGNGVEGTATKPSLVFFYSSQSGWAVRVDGFLANVLQRRRNHDTFKLYRVALERHPELAARFAVGEAPTLVVVEGKTVAGRLEAPRGSREIEEFLAPWLRSGRAVSVVRRSGSAGELYDGREEQTTRRRERIVIDPRGHVGRGVHSRSSQRDTDAGKAGLREAAVVRRDRREGEGDPEPPAGGVERS
jgi:hypothetical protein